MPDAESGVLHSVRGDDELLAESSVFGDELLVRPERDGVPLEPLS